ncbi:PLP-dependent aminotransferase family protein [Vibrio navarrensis]
MSRYRQLAELFKTQIQQKTWRAGEKLPSVRATSRSHAVSPGTVLQAYQLLESQGWISAKPQSGYFVTPDLARFADTRATTPAIRQSIDDELYDFLKHQSNKAAVPLGSAFPDPSLFPLTALNRNLASSGRKMSVDLLADNLPPGCGSLRRLIAQRYIQQGMDISHDDIVITSGALEALNLSLQAVVNKGDYVVIETPTFYGALQAVERLGLNAIEVPVNATSGLCLGRLEEAFANYPVRACWLMTNFHNPTGTTLSADKKQAVMDLANRYDVVVIEDDVYAELSFAMPRPLPLKAYDQQDRVLLCGSFSKCLCPGYRIGWVVNQTYHERIQKLQLVSTLSGSAPVQLGVAHYLQHDSYENHLRKLRKSLSARQQKMVDAIKASFPPEVSFFVPQGGYFLWLKLPDGVNSLEVYQKLLESGMTSAYGGLFARDDRHDNYLRLNSSFSERDDFIPVMEKMAQVIRSLLRTV